MKKRPPSVAATAEWIEDTSVWTWSKGVWMTGKRDKTKKRVGPWKFQYRDGTLAGVCTYDKRGLRKGEADWYDVKGALCEHDIYVDGKQHGPQVFIRTSKPPPPLAPMWRALPKPCMRLDMPYVEGRGVHTLFTLYNTKGAKDPIPHVKGKSVDLGAQLDKLVWGSVLALVAKDYVESGESGRLRARPGRFVLGSTHVNNTVAEMQFIPDDGEEPETRYVQADELTRAFTLAADLYFAKKTKPRAQ